MSPPPIPTASPWRTTAVALTLLLATAPGFGCKRSADASTDPATASKTQSNSSSTPPRWLLLPWGTALATSPTSGAVMTLLADPQAEIDPDDRGRVVEVVGSEGDWWIVETVPGYELPDLGVASIEHLDLYRLRLYVPAGTGTALTPPPPPEDAAKAARDAALAQAASVGLIGLLGDPPLQSGSNGAFEDPPTIDWRVSPGTPAYWPDGRSAGTVAAYHAFTDAGRPLDTEAGALRCFAIVLGPAPSPAGSLCFPAEAVVEGQPMAGAFASGLWGADDGAFEGDVWGGLTGDEIGDAYGVGGLGLVGTGQGGGGTGGGTIGIGSISGGGGGSGSGYGYGSGSAYAGEDEYAEYADEADGIVAYDRAASEPAEVEPPLPTVTLDTVSARGPDQGASTRVIEARLRTVARCVATARERGDTIPDALELRLEIDGDGKVHSHALAGKLGKLGTCVEQQVARWRFASEAPGTIEIHLVLDEPK